MSASRGNDPRRARRWLAIVSCLFLSVATSGAGYGQEPEPEPQPQLDAAESADDLFPLHAPARSSLARVQMDWLEWLVACNEGEGDRAEASIDSLLAHTHLLGMETVPALSTAASRRAVEFAGSGDLDRARLALTAAERLHPGRPEGAFAAASVAGADSELLGVLKGNVRGYWRSLEAPQLRYVLLNNVALWLVTVLTLTGLLLVGVLMMARGPELYFDVHRFCRRYVPTWTAHLVCLILFSWPFLLPAGVLWIAFYWSVLLWAYGGRLERVALVAIWLFVGSLPAVLSEQGRRVGLALFPPMQSIESAARGELEGDLFSHLALLESILPVNRALKHFGADIHRKLGQMEDARALYRDILAGEPKNPSALNDLGLYYFDASDYNQAVEHFERASEIGKPTAATLFNLSQAYSELYRFNESEGALIRARAADSDAVNRWLQEATEHRVVPMNGGLDRVNEIRAALRSQWRLGEEVPSWLGHWRQALSLPLVLVFTAIAVAVRFFTRRGRIARPKPNWLRPSLDRLRGVLLPGVPEAEGGHAGSAFLWLLALVGIVSLPMAGRVGYSLPWLHEPSAVLLPLISAVGLLVFFGVRLWAQGRGRE